MAPTADRHYRRGILRSVWPSPALPASRRAARRADADYGASAEPDWREVPWAKHQSTITLPGGPVNVVDLGTGDQAVVFVHGLGGCWQNWLENLPAVAAAGYRAIAFDLPGFGRSALPSASISITEYARTVDALCAELALGPVALVGNSMGGFIAAETAIRHPERAELLVLVDAAGISSSENRNPISDRVGRFLVAGAAKPGTDPQVRRAQARAMLRRPGFVQLAMGSVARHPTLLARDLLAEQVQHTGSAGFFPALEALIGHRFVDHLSDIGCPTLVIHGADDVLVPLGDAHEFARRIPRATTLILEDTGHVPMFERPRTFNRALLEFLDQAVAPDRPDPGSSPTIAGERA
ncbi:unannotated protein [freshwater metagenome]|uniref:Unannotated protein n=1 Tax=freshwater metagenome TaxID=449393 RepID=A0A6J7DX51_9ZZZZ|nr:alpha/beta fold hydrolase [Actinomycetota bacterium]